MRPASEAELERQRADIEAAFRVGWIPRNVGQPQAPGPPLTRMPFIRGVSDDAEVIITGTGTGSWRCVAVLFSHESFPGIRFGHRCTPPSDKHASIWLMEEIETGALLRMMQAEPAADDAGIVWTTWGATAPTGPGGLHLR